MDITPERRARLNALMEERRLGLDMTWREVARSAGISYEALRALRRGPGGIVGLTARKIDRALHWQGGSVAAIINGDPGDPAELPAAGRTGDPDQPPAIVREYWDNPAIGPAVRGIWGTDGRYVKRDQKIAMITRLAEILTGDNGSGHIPVADDGP